MRDPNRTKRDGFTLVELTVVLALVSLVLVIAMPMVIKIVELNAYTQAYNMMAAQLRAARSTAVFTEEYAAVHHQRIDDEMERLNWDGTTEKINEGLGNRFLTAIVVMDQSDGSRQKNVLDTEGVTLSGSSEPGAGVDTPWDMNSQAVVSGTSVPVLDNAHFILMDMNGNGQYDEGTQDYYVVGHILDATAEFELDDTMIAHGFGVKKYKLSILWGALPPLDNPFAGYAEAYEGEKERNAEVKVTVEHAEGITEVMVDETTTHSKWWLVGTFPFDSALDPQGSSTVGTVTVSANMRGRTTLIASIMTEPLEGYKVFSPAAGQAPVDVPGGMAFGELKELDPSNPASNVTFNFSSIGSGTTGTYTTGVFDNSQWSADNKSGDFTSFSVVFGPYGAVTRRPLGEMVSLHGWRSFTNPSSGSRAYWNSLVANNGTFGEPGATILTLFNWSQFQRAPDGDEAMAYLNRSARMLPVNMYSGELMRGD